MSDTKSWKQWGWNNPKEQIKFERKWQIRAEKDKNPVQSVEVKTLFTLLHILQHLVHEIKCLYVGLQGSDQQVQELLVVKKSVFSSYKKIYFTVESL